MPPSSQPTPLPPFSCAPGSNLSMVPSFHCGRQSSELLDSGLGLVILGAPASGRVVCPFVLISLVVM